MNIIYVNIMMKSKCLSTECLVLMV